MLNPNHLKDAISLLEICTNNNFKTTNLRIYTSSCLNITIIQYNMYNYETSLQLPTEKSI